MAFSMALPWSGGEEKMHDLLHVPPQDNPTSAMLTPQASFMLQRAPLLAIGTLDSDSRPWTALWGGVSGFSEPLGGGFVGTRTLVDGKFDGLATLEADHRLAFLVTLGHGRDVTQAHRHPV